MPPVYVRDVDHPSGQGWGGANRPVEMSTPPALLLLQACARVDGGGVNKELRRQECENSVNCGTSEYKA